MKQLVVEGRVAVGGDVPLSPEQAHYLFDVIRLAAGEMLVVVDGRGNRYSAELLPRSRRSCRIRSRLPQGDSEPALDVTLCVPLLKGDKLELVVQKAVELGAGEIRFYRARRSVVKPGGNWQRKLARWQAIARAATQQCGRTRVPAISGLHGLEALARPGGIGLYAWEEEKGTNLRVCLAGMEQGSKLTLLTGPEGGLEAGEARELNRLGFRAVTLGPRILRAETAAIALLACAMYAAGEME